MSRQNLSPNPACGANVTGWAGGATPAQSGSVSGFPVPSGAVYTAGTFQQTPTGAATPGVVYTGSVYVLSAGFPQSGKTLYLAFTRSVGGDDFSNTTSFSVPASTVTRISITATAPASTTGMYLVLDAMNAASATITLSANLMEAAPALDTYFDGNTGGASWDGTANNSTSTLSGATNIGLADGGSSATTLAVAAALPLADAGSALDALTLAATAHLADAGAAADLLTVRIVESGAATGSWNSILSAANSAKAIHEERQRRNMEPLECPRHHWPLTRQDGIYHCLYGGHVIVPPVNTN